VSGRLGGQWLGRRLPLERVDMFLRLFQSFAVRGILKPKENRGAHNLSRQARPADDENNRDPNARIRPKTPHVFFSRKVVDPFRGD
jgi:hypothetical protein